VTVGGSTVLRKRKEPKAKRSIAAALLRDMQGTAAEKLAAFAKLRARGAFDGMDRRELLRIENMLRCGKLIVISAVGERRAGSGTDLHRVRTQS
jgi:hypothetical protein